MDAHLDQLKTTEGDAKDSRIILAPTSAPTEGLYVATYVCPGRKALVGSIGAATTSRTSKWSDPVESLVPIIEWYSRIL